MNIKLDLRGLERLRRNAKAFHGTHQVKLLEILSPAFMRNNTRFSSLQDMLRRCDVSEEIFGEMCKADKDEVTRKNTKFRSWQEMINAGSVVQVEVVAVRLAGRFGAI
jgi:hypothetical protein